jgi:hypothetical protein
VVLVSPLRTEFFKRESDCLLNDRRTQNVILQGGQQLGVYRLDASHQVVRADIRPALPKRRAAVEVDAITAVRPAERGQSPAADSASGEAREQESGLNIQSPTASGGKAELSAAELRLRLCSEFVWDNLQRRCGGRGLRAFISRRKPRRFANSAPLMPSST